MSVTAPADGAPEESWPAFPVFLVVLFASRVALALTLRLEWTDLLLYAGYAGEVLEGHLPFRDFSYSYPPWSIVSVVLPGFFTATVPQYIVFFRLEMAVFELGTVVLLHATARSVLGLGIRAQRRGALLYLVLSTASAPVLLDRLDLPVAFLVLASFYLLVGRRKETLGWGAVALGISWKLVPVFTAPYLALHASRDEPSLMALLRSAGRLLALGILLNLPFLMWIGPSVGQCLTMHWGRGIQIESSYASLLLPLREVGLPLDVELTNVSYNLVTSLTPALKSVSSALLLLGEGLVLALAIGGWMLRKAQGHREAAHATLVAMLASLLVLLLFNKVLSPQFFVWVYPLAALDLSVDRPGRRTDTVLWAGLAILTTVIYPILYESLVGFGLFARLVLLCRNLILATLTVRCVVRVGRTSSRRSSEAASHSTVLRPAISSQSSSSSIR